MLSAELAIKDLLQRRLDDFPVSGLFQVAPEQIDAGFCR